MLWRTRLSSFAVGFASATAYGAYVLRKDLAKSHEQLLSQARARTARCLCAPGPSSLSYPSLTRWGQAHAFEERLARLEVKTSGAE